MLIVAKVCIEYFLVMQLQVLMQVAGSYCKATTVKYTKGISCICLFADK